MRKKRIDAGFGSGRIEHVLYLVSLLFDDIEMLHRNRADSFGCISGAVFEHTEIDRINNGERQDHDNQRSFDIEKHNRSDIIVEAGA